MAYPYLAAVCRIAIQENGGHRLAGAHFIEAHLYLFILGLDALETCNEAPFHNSKALAKEPILIPLRESLLDPRYVDLGNGSRLGLGKVGRTSVAMPTEASQHLLYCRFRIIVPPEKMAPTEEAPH